MSLLEIFDLCRRAEYRFLLQERDFGLDIYLSGFWGLTPLLLAVAAGTLFLLSLFHVVPLRSRAVFLLLSLGFVAFLVGLIGAYMNFQSAAEVADSILLPTFTEGTGTLPNTIARRSALLALPLVLGLGVLAECLGCSLFVAFFGAREKGSKE